MPYDVPKAFSFSIFFTVFIAFIVCNIVLTIYGSKTIGSCRNKNASIAIFTSLFLIFSWIGHLLPYYGNIAALLSMIITIGLIMLSHSAC